MRTNPRYEQLQPDYLFSRIGEKVRDFCAANPGREVIRLGIGDVTRPLVPAVIDAMHRAVDEMADAATFRGYGEYQGALFLREAVCGYYAAKGVTLSPEEIFISDGAKSDVSNLLDIIECPCTALIPSPVYPVYVDTSIMAGNPIVYARGTGENGFLPLPDCDVAADIIYLCSPNNPTGAVYTHAQLTEWVAYARSKNAVILFDGAYEGFIGDPSLPTSIYEIEGAKECAIEICSFSKTAGFTGTRCGYTVVPLTLNRYDIPLHRLWRRRQTTKFNGVSYIVQRGAEAALSPDGLAQNKANIAYYMENARLIGNTLQRALIPCFGGANAPYVWFPCPGMDSWTYFDYLLERAGIVGTPGIGFGMEGYFRLSAFNTRENTQKAMDLFKAI